MNRRSYLTALGASVTAAGAVIVRDASDGRRSRETDTDPAKVTPSPPETGETRQFSDRYENVVDIRQRGADDSGTEPIDELLSIHAADDTLLWFPSGRYRINQVRLNDLTNFGMVGGEATFVLGQSSGSAFLIMREMADVLVEGFTVDATAENTAAWFDFRCVDGNNVIRNYTVEGFGDVEERTNGFTLAVEGSETSLTVDRADLRDGAKNGAATFVFPQRRFVDPTRPAGSLTFRACKMHGWGKEGLYASAHSGPLRVIGGEYVNNAITQVRVGGGNAPSSAVVRDVEVRVDNVPPYVPESNRIFRGIWLEEGDKATVEDCDVRLDGLSSGPVQGGIIVNSQFGRATVRNCQITMGANSPGLRIERPLSESETDDVRIPSLDELPSEWSVTCEDLCIKGTSESGCGIAIRGREGCTFEDIVITQEGEAGDGIKLWDADEVVFTGGSVVTPRYPAIVYKRVARDGSCRLVLNDVAQFQGTGIEDWGDVLSEPASGRHCLEHDVVIENLEPGDPALAVTRADETGLYGRVVSADSL